MKPTVISNANISASNGSGNLQTGGNNVTIPNNNGYRGQSTSQQQSQFNTQPQHYVSGDSQATGYETPGSLGRNQRQQQPHRQHQQEIPAHFQRDFDFAPEVGMDMFPRTRLGRMAHDPFGDFGGTTRKRTSLHDPQFHNDGFSRYFDDAEFGFPQFNSLGRRRINPHNDDDFFNRLPSEFRQYIPESFTQRRAGTSMTDSPGSGPTMAYQQQSRQQQPQSHIYNTMMSQPSSKNVCDAAIQTESPTGRSEVDHRVNTENLYQHGLRNTMDMGVKSPSENENQSPRSSSAPPTEQKNHQQKFSTKPQQIPINKHKHPTLPPQQLHQFATQTSPPIQSGGYDSQSPQFQKMHYASQQMEGTQPPQNTGTYIRTIPIFVEGRSEPLINNKEIPSENAPPTDAPGSGNSRAFTPPKQHAYRPTPLNTQQQPTQSSGVLPQTPHTVDTINKIQDIQRDVLELMSRVEKFAGTRVDKEYVHLDEMLTRNLLKLDNIDTNGKDSIRLARREAIKCIQASINVLEAKAEENKKASQVNDANEEPVQEVPAEKPASTVPETETHKLTSAAKSSKHSITNAVQRIAEPADAKNEPIPLPPPENPKYNEVRIEDCPEDDAPTICINEESTPKADTPMQNSSDAK